MDVMRSLLSSSYCTQYSLFLSRVTRQMMLAFSYLFQIGSEMKLEMGLCPSDCSCPTAVISENTPLRI